MNEEEIKIKMDDSVDTSLAWEGTDLFVDLWEAQPCPWDPDRDRQTDRESVLSLECGFIY